MVTRHCNSSNVDIWSNVWSSVEEQLTTCGNVYYINVIFFLIMAPIKPCARNKYH